jgi:hypothetical protein
MELDSRLLGYLKARLAAGLRVSWTPRAGLEPASVTMDSRLLYLLSYLGVVSPSVATGIRSNKMARADMSGGDTATSGVTGPQLRERPHARHGVTRV